MQDRSPDTDTTPLPPASRRVRALRAIHAFGRAFACVGIGLAPGLVFLFPALVFRHDASRDIRVLVGLASASTWLVAFLFAAWVHATTAPVARRRMRSRAGRIPLRLRMSVLVLLPFVTFAGLERVRALLVARQDPLYGFCERGLSRALAQPGVGAPTDLDVIDGRLTLVVPANPVRNARWWVDVDADDTVGRRCTFHSAVTFGEDPMVLHIPLPMESDEMPGRPFGLVPGSVVVVHGVSLTLDGVANAQAAKGPPMRWARDLDMIYEVPDPHGMGRRSAADFVNAPRGARATR
jgi:hypothetical protein